MEKTSYVNSGKAYFKQRHVQYNGMPYSVKVYIIKKAKKL